MSSSLNLCCLPAEIKIGILSYLSLKDLHNMSCVSKEWLQIATDDVLWKIFAKSVPLEEGISIKQQLIAWNQQIDELPRKLQPLGTFEIQETFQWSGHSYQIHYTAREAQRHQWHHLFSGNKRKNILVAQYEISVKRKLVMIQSLDLEKTGWSIEIKKLFPLFLRVNCHQIYKLLNS
jgi:hypothetical protein